MEIKIFGKRLSKKEQTIFLNGEINYLFGKNGAGKSYVLSKIIEDDNTIIDKVKHIEEKQSILEEVQNQYNNHSHYESIPNRQVGEINIYKFVSDDFENILMSVLNPSNTSFAQITFNKWNYTSYKKNKNSIEEITKKLQKNINSIIKTYIPKVSLVVKPRLMDTKENNKITQKFIGVYFKLNHGVNLRDISSGERRILSIMMYMFLIPKKGSLVLLDEPFIHFHSSLIKDVVAFLETFSKNHNLTFLISTHNINSIEYWNLENTISVQKKNNISIINSYNGNELLLSELNSIPRNINDLFFSEMKKTFFQEDVILVEGISDKFYLDSILQGKKQVISIDGKDNIIKTLFQVSWHAKKIQVLLDGDVNDKLQQEVAETLEIISKKIKIDYSIKTTDDFLDDKTNTDIEAVFLGCDGHKMETKEKVIAAFKFKSQNKTIENKKFIKWITK